MKRFFPFYPLVFLLGLVQCKPSASSPTPTSNTNPIATAVPKFQKTATALEATPTLLSTSSTSVSSSTTATSLSSSSVVGTNTASLGSAGDANTASPANSAKPLRISKMALLGDSIGVGLFSDTKLGSQLPQNSPVFSFIGSILNGEALDTALLTTNATYRDNYPSAFIGKLNVPNCFSLACQLHLTASSANNFAVAGSQVDDVLDTQLPALASDTNLVVVEIGANDFCSEDYNQNDYLTTYKQILDRLATASNQPVVVVIPIPNIPSVFQNAPAATKSLVYNFFIPLQLTCGDIRDGQFAYTEHEPFCPRLVSSNTNTMASEWLSVNAGLANLVNSYAQTGRFVFVQNLTTWSIQQTDLAMDCFHPNLSAHQKLAQMTWASLQAKIQLSNP